MRREHLAHLLRAASRVVDRRDLLVVGSQSVLGAWDEDAPPEAAVLSMEADLAVVDDPEGVLADRISGAIGELSSFDQTFGVSRRRVGLETAILPEGRRSRAAAGLAGGTSAALTACYPLRWWNREIL